jgi:transcriptional regulator with XRE-family HTH domain
MATRGRPSKPLNPDASMAAWLGAELRARRQERGLTLKTLGELTGYTYQHVSEVERAKASPSEPFVAACDHALEARGRLLALLPAVINERAVQRHRRAARRRYSGSTHTEGGEDVDPTTRRGVLGAGAAATLGAAGIVPTPAAAREVDPELAAHWTCLLDVLSRHDDAFGPHDVLAVIRHQLDLIAAHRRVAHGDLRAQLLRVESRWTEFASFLSNDVGQPRRRDAYTERALQLAREAGDRDSVAVALMRQGQWAVQELDAQRAVAFTQAALRVSGTSAQVRARCALRAANGHALAGDEPACQHRLDDAYELAEPSAEPGAVTRAAVRATEARSWLWMQPRRAIPLYEDALREWPRDQVRDGGLQRARLALACAATGEHDRADAEGRKALSIARATKSITTTRELKRLSSILAAR